MTRSHTPEGAKLLYGAVNHPVLAAIPTSARRILDVGCGTGVICREVKDRKPAEVVGLTYSETEVEKERESLDRVVVCELNDFEPIDFGTFDCVVCRYVLEHLNWPDHFLSGIRRHFAPRRRIVVALPNAMTWWQRVAFLAGRFRYAYGGLMDRTYFRFYDWKPVQELVSGSGFNIISARTFGVFLLSRLLFGLGRVIDRVALSVCPGLFAWQFVIVAELGGAA